MKLPRYYIYYCYDVLPISADTWYRLVLCALCWLCEPDDFVTVYAISSILYKHRSDWSSLFWTFERLDSKVDGIRVKFVEIFWDHLSIIEEYRDDSMRYGSQTKTTETRKCWSIEKKDGTFIQQNPIIEKWFRTSPFEIHLKVICIGICRLVDVNKILIWIPIGLQLASHIDWTHLFLGPFAIFSLH